MRCEADYQQGYADGYKAALNDAMRRVQCDAGESDADTGLHAEVIEEAEIIVVPPTFLPVLDAFCERLGGLLSKSRFHA